MTRYQAPDADVPNLRRKTLEVVAILNPTSGEAEACGSPKAIEAARPGRRQALN